MTHRQNSSLSDKQYRAIRKASLSKWLSYESETHLLEILSLIEKCWSIHAVLSEYRLMQSVDKKSFDALRREGRISRNLRYWISENA